MNSKLQRLLFSILFVGSGALWAQEITPETLTGAKEVITLEYKFVPSVAEQIRTGTFIPAEKPSTDPINPRLRSGVKAIPGKGSKGRDALADRQLNAEQSAVRAPSLIFNTTTSTSTPSDPTGAVGGNFYLAAWNVAWQIFDKDGTPAAGMPNPASLASLLSDNDGDPIALYDHAADRYILLQFETSAPFGFKIAISQTNDPINDGWHTYGVSDFGTSQFPDYEKMSIWSDGYYMSANIGTNQVFALERDKMLTGDPTASMQTFSLPGGNGSPPLGFYSPHFLSVTNDNLPAAGGATVIFHQDDAWAGVGGADRLHLWTVDVDWATPANSMITGPNQIPVTPFVGVFDGGNFNNLTQPTGGPDIDALQSIIMNQAQFRRFGTHNSAVFNHVIDVGGGTEQAAIRWYELRQTADNQPWTLHQEGTYVASDGRHAWNASMAMDATGNIAMGFTTMGGTSNLNITSAYTGQFVGAPAGVMNAIEEVIITSNAGSSSNRYADYSHLTVDPDDDATFWFVNEVFTPSRTNTVGVFQLTAPQADDVGVSAITAPNSGLLTAAESITVDIRNFGTNAQSNIPVRYTIDGGTAVEETYAGTVAAGATESYTFTQTADLSTTNQTYTIVAYTELAGDAEPSNDSTTKMVTNAVQYCQPAGDCSFGDGVTMFELGTIDVNSVPCSTGYEDLTSNMTDLDRAAGNNIHNGILQSGWSDENLSMWIDFNDDGDFDDPGELVLDTFIVPLGQEDTDQAFQITIPTDANLGTHVLRTRGFDPDFAGTLNDPCGDLQYGNTVDFMVNIIDSSLSIDEFEIGSSELNIYTKPNDQYEIVLTTPFTEKLSFNLYNVLGQQLAYGVIDKDNQGRYVYELDMSYASSGVYIVEVGRGNNFKVGRIIVD